MEGEGEERGRRRRRERKGKLREKRGGVWYLRSWLALIDSTFSPLYSPSNCLCQFSRIHSHMRPPFRQFRALHNIRKFRQFRIFRQVRIVRTQFCKIWIARRQMTELRVLDGIMNITMLFIHVTHARSLHIYYCIFI